MRIDNQEPLKLHFFTTSRFHYDSRGKLRTFSPLFRPDYWEPFLSHFSEIVIYARVSEDVVEDDGQEFGNSQITVVPLPYYRGAIDYVRKSRRVNRFVSSQVRNREDFYALWVPTPFSLSLAKSVSRVRAPLLCIAIGDPRGVLESIFAGPPGRILAWLSSRSMRKTMLKANAAVYVTLHSLQELYPTRPGVPTLARSNVRFPEQPSAISAEGPSSEVAGETGANVSLIAVGSQEQNYKGHDLLIDAVARLQSEGYELSLTIVGQGALHEELVQRASDQNVAEIKFLKHVGDHNAVAREVARHDIFVMPSRTEGMPKALLEAMSVGVFSMGSDVGGIPEVLDAECVFSADSVDSLVERLRYFIDNPQLISDKARRQRLVAEDIRQNHSGNRVLEVFLGVWIEQFVGKTPPQK